MCKIRFAFSSADPMNMAVLARCNSPLIDSNNATRGSQLGQGLHAPIRWRGQAAKWPVPMQLRGKFPGPGRLQRRLVYRCMTTTTNDHSRGVVCLALPVSRSQNGVLVDAGIAAFVNGNLALVRACHWLSHEMVQEGKSMRCTLQSQRTKHGTDRCRRARG